MKKLTAILLAAALLLALQGCSAPADYAPIAATTLPVYELTHRICERTGLSVTRLVTESVSCLHDYSLNVNQVRAAEAAEVIVISGAGLEEFMEDLLRDKNVIDSSAGIALLECTERHDHGHSHEGHHHEVDSHIWLDPNNAKNMARNICKGLSDRYPKHTETFETNLEQVLSDLDDLITYGEAQLSSLSCRNMITFHDGFGYLANAFDLTILEAVEEESGSEASASELIHLIEEVRRHALPAIFTEANGAVSAASVIARETGAALFTLDMAMAGDSYFDALYHNIDTLKEALG